MLERRHVASLDCESPRPRRPRLSRPLTRRGEQQDGHTEAPKRVKSFWTGWPPSKHRGLLRKPPPTLKQHGKSRSIRGSKCGVPHHLPTTYVTAVPSEFRYTSFALLLNQLVHSCPGSVPEVDLAKIELLRLGTFLILYPTWFGTVQHVSCFDGPSLSIFRGSILSTLFEI